ncbi:MAG: hypothetical protein ACD_15C00137G0015 [uncultured bacterium]|nr:MAG: hypothetical protein ACD_15C00137G0015 [uncultured bacterium]
MKGADRNKPCQCGSGKKYKKCCIGKEMPILGTFQHVFNYGSSDPFFARMVIQMLEIRDFIFRLDQIDSFDEAYDSILQNLTEAKIVKDRCIELISKHTEGVECGRLARIDQNAIQVDECIDTDLNIWFKDFFIRGNIATKNLIKFAKFFDYEIPFIFTETEKFEKRKAEFLKKSTSDLDKYLMDLIEAHRSSWYASFVELRNKIEHESFRVPDIKYRNENGKIKPMIAKFNSLTIEEFLNLSWENLFVLCEDIVILLMTSKLPKEAGLSIMHIPENKRDPEKPIRYKIIVGMPSDAKKVSYKDLHPTSKK